MAKIITPWRIAAVIVCFGILAIPTFFFINILGKGWNEYWFDRFADGQCGEICGEYGMTLSMQNPSYCGCRTEVNGQHSEIQIRRPSTFADNIKIVFGGS